jgi:hypothetical protein
LLELAANLLARAKTDAKERVPIVLNLSSWKKKQPLAEWIVMELSEKYGVPVKIARSWLRKDYLVALLDGLDEVPTALQPDCVAAINDFIDGSEPSGIVVCCRLTEYQWLPKRLKLNGAICLESLSSEEVSKYLAAGGSKLAALRESLTTDPVLQELAQTPLMLSVMSLACQGADGNELDTRKGDAPEERRKQIFRLYIEQMFQRKGTTSFVFPKEKIIGWLSWLAGKMREHSQSVFLIEGLQPSWLDTRAERAAFGTVAALGFGLISGLSYGLNSGLSHGLSYGPSWGSIFGLTVFAGVGLGCWWESPVKNSVMSGLIIGLILWLTGGLISGLTSGLIGGLTIGWVGGFTDSVKVDKASPNQGIKLSRRNSLTAFIITCLIYGLCYLPLSLWISPQLSRNISALGFGLTLVTIFALNRGGSAVIKHYTLRLILWLKGYTPFKFVQFLDHCAKLILLKKVGGGYIFIHRMLLDYFADLPTQTASNKPASDRSDAVLR